MAFKKSTEIQSIMFDKKKWTVSLAKKWLKDHQKKVPAVDTTSEYHRFRQAPPFQFEKGTFRTISLGKATGIKAVIAVPKRKKNPKKNHSRSKPWTPTTLVDLATPISIDMEGGEVLKFPVRGRFAMGSNVSGTEIWIVSKKGAKSVKASDERGEKLYERFTGFEHDDVAKLIQVNPKSIKRIGRAMNIVYRSDKFSRPGNTSDYVHAFELYPTVSVDSVDKPTIVTLRGGRLKITKEGITG